MTGYQLAATAGAATCGPSSLAPPAAEAARFRATFHVHRAAGAVGLSLRAATLNFHAVCVPNPLPRQGAATRLKPDRQPTAPQRRRLNPPQPDLEPAVTGNQLLPQFQPEGASFTKLPRKALTLWRLSLIVTTIIVTTTFGAAPTIGLTLLRPTAPVWPIWVFLAPYLGWSAFRWHRMETRWHITGYCLTNEELLIRGGLLHRYLSALPFSRIQTVEVHSGPIERRLNLATVTARTGTFHGSSVPHLNSSDAEAIRTLLTERARQNQVAL
jgi:hypothetical protein